jgi:Flp pilus assembly protein TadG
VLTTRLSSKSRSPARGRRRGAAAVEFAIIAPIFFLLLGGIIEFGQAFRIEHLLSVTTRRGTRSAIMAGSTYGNVQQKIQADCAELLGVSAADITVDVMVNGSSENSLSTAEEADEIKIVTSIPFSKAGVGFFSNTFSNSTLSSTCTLEHK